MERVESVSKWFINELNPDPLKLQKLLYFAQGISFCMHDEALFDDDFEAWVHGPVIKKIYFEYREYGYEPIDIKYDVKFNNKATIDVLEYVKRVYGKYDGKYLENITHNQEPWNQAREGLDPDEKINKTISKESIANYFIMLMNQPDGESW